MGKSTKKIYPVNFLLFTVVTFALLISSIQVLFSNTASAAPISSAETCKAVGGEWKNLAPTGGVPKMGCAGVSIAAQQSLDWQVQSLLYYRALGKCFNQATRSSIEYSKVQSGEWFQDGIIAIGPYVRDVYPDVGDDSVMTCSGDTGKTLVNNALNLWGINKLDMLCGAGLTWNQFPNNSARCKDASIGNGDFLANKFWNNTGGGNPGTDGYIQGREGDILKYIRDTIYSGANPTINDAGWYQFYRKVFFQQCDTTQKITEGSTTKPSGTDSRDVELTIVSDTGSSVNKWYRIDASMGTNQFTTRLGDPPGYADVNRTCQEVASYIGGNNAKAFEIAIQQNPKVTNSANTNPPATEADGSSATTCSIPGVGWIICPVTSFLADIADNAYSFLSESFLKVDINTVAAGSPTHAVWSSMRTIANVAFVIAFLFIIFSQLTGQGIANYGVKKMLPRLVIAAILVNLSFIICQLAIDLSNILGVSIKQAFDSAGNAITLPQNIGSESGNWAGIAVAVLGGTAIAWGLGITILLPFLVSAVIAFIMVFFILVIRQVLIVMLVVLAPLAFVAFILPNTGQLFTKWRKMFVGLLLVFPMIGLLFGAAGLASRVANAAAYSSTGDTEGWIAKIVAAGIIALPLFLLPSLLKKSLDSAGNIGQTINKLGGKLGSNARNKTANSGVLKSIANRKARTRSEIGAGIYSGNNPVSKTRSSINRALNKNKAYNALTGDYGTIRGANINKLEGDEMKLAEAAVQLKSRSFNGKTGVSATEQFEEAIKSNDTVAAMAAQNILMRTGGPGVNDTLKVLSKMHSSMPQALRTTLAENITENHAQAAKIKSNNLLKWAASGGSDTIESFTSNPNTWSGMNARELADQTDDAFNAAINSGGVSAETIQTLRSERMSESINQAKRNTLSQYANSTSTSSAVPSSTQQTPPPPQDPYDQVNARRQQEVQANVVGAGEMPAELKIWHEEQARRDTAAAPGTPASQAGSTTDATGAAAPTGASEDYQSKMRGNGG